MSYRLSEEQEMFRKTVRRFADEKVAPRVTEMDREDRLPRELYEEVARMGFIALFYPSEYDGAEAGMLTCCLATEELCRVSPALGGMLGVAHALFSSCFRLFATKEQKDKYFPDIISGKKLCMFGLTEPDAGSDIISMRSRAILDGDEYILNGVKNFNSGIDFADMTLVFVKTDPNAGMGGISTFIVEKGTPGFSYSVTGRMMGFRGIHHCESVFEDCRVPKENLIGKEGEGFRNVVKVMDEGRTLTGASGVGTAQGALEYAIRYAKERIQFGKPIAEFQAISHMLADMATMTETARHLVYRAATLVQEHSKESMKLATMAKYYATDVAMEVASKAVDILGGYGYSEEYPVERMMRDAKGLQLLEGTNQIQRNAVAKVLLA
ncbi:MAG: acyl-CoA dehydrogenase family protein [Thermodesulfobacteriota bacterium]|nr:acyl-CoA dehydrogenase family protein [Thermodesulfobacteriota bacterium]